MFPFFRRPASSRRGRLYHSQCVPNGLPSELAILLPLTPRRWRSHVLCNVILYLAYGGCFGIANACLGLSARLATCCANVGPAQRCSVRCSSRALARGAASCAQVFGIRVCSCHVSYCRQFYTHVAGCAGGASTFYRAYSHVPSCPCIPTLIAADAVHIRQQAFVNVPSAWSVVLSFLISCCLCPHASSALSLQPSASMSRR